MPLIETEDSQLTERRTMLDTLTSTKWEEIRDSVWSGLTGGAEIKTSESISRWERSMVSDPLSQASIMKRSTLTSLKRIKKSQICVHQDKLSDSFIHEQEISCF